MSFGSLGLKKLRMPFVPNGIYRLCLIIWLLDCVGFWTCHSTACAKSRVWISFTSCRNCSSVQTRSRALRMSATLRTWRCWSLGTTRSGQVAHAWVLQHVSLPPTPLLSWHWRRQTWDVPENVGVLLDEATVLSLTVKGTLCVVLVLLTLPLLKLTCVPKLNNLLMTSLEESHFGGHIGTFNVTFTV